MAAAHGNVVLEEAVDEDYEPTEKDLKDYAEWLGMDVDRDSDHLWIAREGLKAPLPKPWKPCQVTDTEEIFYFNFETGESVWDHPVDDFYKSLFEEARRKAEAPKRVVTLEVTPDTDGILNVSCINMCGNEIGTVSLPPKQTLRKLAKELGQQMKLSKVDIEQFRFVLTDGRLLTDSDQLRSLGDIFLDVCDLSCTQEDQRKSETTMKNISAPQHSKARKKHRKKDRQHRRTNPEGSCPKSTIRSLPPLKLDANKTRIAQLKKSGALELARFVDDCLLE